MNILKEAHSLIGFATYCPLLYKATTDDDTATPGYTIEEIIKISYLSSQHRLYLIDFLLDKLLTSGWPGKQKIVRILLQLSKKGHYEIRVLLRQKDGIIRKAASQGGVPDPFLANTPQLFLNSAVQELLVVLFDPVTSKSDNEKFSRREHEEQQTSNVSTGYGSSATTSSGKYEGFGNSSIVKHESIASQVYDMVGKVVTSSEKNKEEYLKSLTITDKGNYKPLPPSGFDPLSSMTASTVIPSKMHISGPPTYSSMISSKVHISGKAGGGWASDEEEEEFKPLQQITFRESEPPKINEKTKADEEVFIDQFLATHFSWPVQFDGFLNTGVLMQNLNHQELLVRIVKKINVIMNLINDVEVKKCEDNIVENVGSSISKVENVRGIDANVNCCRIPKLSENETQIMVILLLIEYSYYNSWIAPSLIHENCSGVLVSLELFKLIHDSIRAKSKKLYLILNTYRSRHSVKNKV